MGTENWLGWPWDAWSCRCWDTVRSRSGPTALLSRCPTADRSSWALTVKLPGEQGGWEEG